jgi:hypothetical protein
MIPDVNVILDNAIDDTQKVPQHKGSRDTCSKRFAFRKDRHPIGNLLKCEEETMKKKKKKPQ